MMKMKCISINGISNMKSWMEFFEQNKRNNITKQKKWNGNKTFKNYMFKEKYGEVIIKLQFVGCFCVNDN